MKSIKVTITKNVSRCYDCPYFDDHPHEPYCTHPTLKGWDKFEVFEDREQMKTRRPKKCPL